MHSINIFEGMVHAIKADHSESRPTKDSFWVWNQPTDHAPNTTNKLPVYI